MFYAAFKNVSVISRRFLGELPVLLVHLSRHQPVSCYANTATLSAKEGSHDYHFKSNGFVTPIITSLLCHGRDITCSWWRTLSQYITEADQIIKPCVSCSVRYIAPIWSQYSYTLVIRRVFWLAKHTEHLALRQSNEPIKLQLITSTRRALGIAAVESTNQITAYKQHSPYTRCNRIL